MGKQITLPKGLYMVGRDIPEGAYFIKANEYMVVTHCHKDSYGNNTEDEYYIDKSSPLCRLSLEKGDKVKVDEDFDIQRISDTMVNFD